MRAFANCHSHVFHRALRGRVGGDSAHQGRPRPGTPATFWSWRDEMYSVAAVLDPDLLHRLARATYAEMRLAGIGVVGEFHYLHHQPDGTPYDDANVMGDALIEAARDVGLRICLLDTCYTLADSVQRRFDDGDAEQWASRVRDLAARHAGDADVVIGAAIHSVRAVPREQLPTVARALPDAPLHVHASEQPAENEACLAATGLTPVAVLAEAGVWSPRTTAVHATHLTDDDVRLLGDARAFVCFCPTTEADLADGIGPARELRDAGSPLSLGSDQHAVVDPLLEARALEHGDRLRTGQRGRFSPAELVEALTSAGNAALGWPDAGALIPGAPADLVAVRLDSVRTAGCRPDQVVYAATAADVRTVVSNGRVVAVDGRHEQLGDVGELLRDAIEELWA
jgi:formiminoglutamate deiminase